MAKKENFVVKELKASAATYESKNDEYGDAYKRHGQIMEILFPNGVVLDNSLDYNRYSIFNMIVGKAVRYSGNFETGGHQDSMRDIQVYSAMLNELDSGN